MGMSIIMINAIGSLTLHQIYDYVAGFVFVCSILGSFLPPYDWFAPWPKFQAVYKVVTMTISRWGAINIKSLVYANTIGGGNGNNNPGQNQNQGGKT